MNKWIEGQIYGHMFFLGFLFNSIVRRLSMNEIPNDVIYPIILFIGNSFMLFVLFKSRMKKGLHH